MLKTVFRLPGRLGCALAAALILMAGGVQSACAEDQLVGFMDEQKTYMDTERLQYFIDPRTNIVYYDVWTKNVYSDAGKENMIRKIKAMGEYRKDWDNLSHTLIHKYYRRDRAEVKDIAFAFMTKDDRILELGEVPPDAAKWEAVRPKTIDDDIYTRIKLYEDAYQDKMIRRSMQNRYKTIAATSAMTAAIDTANAKFIRDKYSGQQYADVWIRTDLSAADARSRLEARRSSGKPIKGWNHLGYTVDKSYYDFRTERYLIYGIAHYTKQGVLLDNDEDLPQNSKWDDIIPGSWGEEIFNKVRKYMTGG